MTDLELAVDALILCVGRENFEKALRELTGGENTLRSVDRRELIAEELRSLGIRSNSAGFAALVAIVDIVPDRPGCQTGGRLCKEIYPEAARRLGGTAAGTEKNARTAILSTWDRGGRELWRERLDVSDRPNVNDLVNRVALIVRKRMRRVAVDDT